MPEGDVEKTVARQESHTTTVNTVPKLGKHDETVGTLDPEIDYDTADGDILTIDPISLEATFEDEVYPCSVVKSIRKRKRSDTLAGDNIMRELNDTLGKLGYRDDLQVTFHREFTKAALPHIYGPSFDAQLPKLLDEFGCDVIQQESFGYVSRRGGKSWAVAMFGCAYIWSVPESQITVFAHGQNMSRKLGELMTKMLKTLVKHDPSVRFTVDNVNRKEIIRKGTTRSIECMTDSASYARGFGADVVICDEACQMSYKFFSSVVQPVLEKKSASLICISSPHGSENWVTKMMDLIDEDGKPYFNNLKVRDICDECMKLPYTERAKCEHIRAPPIWKSASKRRKFGKIAEKMKSTGTYLQEERGMDGVSTNSPKFVDVELKEFFDTLPVCSGQNTEYVFISIDPAGKEGGPSDMGITTLYYTSTGNYMVCYIFLFCRRHMLFGGCFYIIFHLCNIIGHHILNKFP
jgi:hypothetical protein